MSSSLKSTPNNFPTAAMVATAIAPEEPKPTAMGMFESTSMFNPQFSSKYQ